MDPDGLGRKAPRRWNERVLRETPLRRWGRPEDVAAAARWLVSPAAAFLTGQIIRVNGGAGTELKKFTTKAQRTQRKTQKKISPQRTQKARRRKKKKSKNNECAFPYWIIDSLLFSALFAFSAVKSLLGVFLGVLCDSVVRFFWSVGMKASRERTLLQGAFLALALLVLTYWGWQRYQRPLPPTFEGKTLEQWLTDLDDPDYQIAGQAAAVLIRIGSTGGPGLDGSSARQNQRRTGRSGSRAHGSERRASRA